MVVNQVLKDIFRIAFNVFIMMIPVDKDQVKLFTKPFKVER